MKPSRRVLIFAAIIISVLGLFSFVYHGKNKPEVYTNLKIVRAENDLREVDTDGDGLMDWEEAILKTSHLKVDTDDDGISDKDEVAKEEPVAKPTAFRF